MMVAAGTLAAVALLVQRQRRRQKGQRAEPSDGAADAGIAELRFFRSRNPD